MVQENMVRSLRIIIILKYNTVKRIWTSGTYHHTSFNEILINHWCCIQFDLSSWFIVKVQSEDKEGDACDKVEQIDGNGDFPVRRLLENQVNNGLQNKKNQRFNLYSIRE